MAPVNSRWSLPRPMAAPPGPPDGTRIAFHVRADPPVVRIIAADGSDAQDVLTGESPAWVKSWQSLP